MSLKVAFAVAVFLALLPALVSCGVRPGDGAQPAGARSFAEHTEHQRTVEEPAPGRRAVARAGDARARAGDGAVARAGDVEETGSMDDSEGSSRKVNLEFRGQRGTRFSGTCSIGGEERRIGGRVPERYSYELGSEKLECEIRRGGPGNLEVMLASANDVRSVQRQTGAGSSVIHLTYSGGGAATFSSSGS